MIDSFKLRSINKWVDEEWLMHILNLLHLASELGDMVSKSLIGALITTMKGEEF